MHEFTRREKRAFLAATLLVEVAFVIYAINVGIVAILAILGAICLVPATHFAVVMAWAVVMTVAKGLLRAQEWLEHGG